MFTTLTKTTKSLIVILSIIYCTLYPLLPRPLNTLTLSSTPSHYQHLGIFLFSEQCLFLILHHCKPTRLILISHLLIGFNVYALWFESFDGESGVRGMGEWTVLFDGLSNVVILFMARNISRPASSGGGTASWKSIMVWTVLFAASLWYNIFALSCTSTPSPTSSASSSNTNQESGAPSPVSLTRLSYDQFHTIWNILFARIVLAMPWRSIVVGVTRGSEVRMMIYNTREKKKICGFGWDVDLAAINIDSKAAETKEIEDIPKIDSGIAIAGLISHGELGLDRKVQFVGCEGGCEGEEKRAFKCAFNLNLVLVLLGCVVMLAEMGVVMGWGLGRVIDRYFS